jgi:predicted DNA-binding transcriptional regulator AlpA
MTTSDSPFLLPDELDKLTRVSDLTRSRMEKRGLFPRRIRIAPRRIAWRRSEVEDWVRDPEAWGKRQAGAEVR